MPDTSPSPYELLGGSPAVYRIVERFYAAMARNEPALARLHPCDEHGNVLRENRERFALFLVGWLGGPQDYVATHGHPRLRMRHARVPVDGTMRDAWLRAMKSALDEEELAEPLRAFLDASFAEAADFLRNHPG